MDGTGIGERVSVRFFLTSVAIYHGCTFGGLTFGKAEPLNIGEPFGVVGTLGVLNINLKVSEEVNHLTNIKNM